MDQNPLLDVCYAKGMENLPGKPKVETIFATNNLSSQQPRKSAASPRAAQRLQMHKPSAKRRRMSDSQSCSPDSASEARRRSLVVKLQLPEDRYVSPDDSCCSQDEDIIYDNINVATASPPRDHMTKTIELRHSIVEEAVVKDPEEACAESPDEVRLMTPVSGFANEDAYQAPKQEPVSPIVAPMADMLQHLFGQLQQNMKQNLNAMEARLKQEEAIRLAKLEMVARERHSIQMNQINHLFSLLKQDGRREQHESRDISSLRDQLRSLREEQKVYAQTTERFNSQVEKKVEGLAAASNAQMTAETTEIKQHLTTTMNESLTRPLAMQLEELGGWLNAIIPQVQSSISSQHCHVLNEMTTLRTLIRTKTDGADYWKATGKVEASPPPTDELVRRFQAPVVASYDRMRKAYEALSSSIGKLPELTAEKLSKRLDTVEQTLGGLTATLGAVQRVQASEASRAPHVLVDAQIESNTGTDLTIRDGDTISADKSGAVENSSVLTRERRRRVERRARKLEEALSRALKDGLCESGERHRRKRQKKPSEPKAGCEQPQPQPQTI